MKLLFSQVFQLMCVWSVILTSILIIRCPDAESAAVNVIFILDASGSMWGRVNNIEKIVTAKERMTELVREFEGVNMGLIVYGHRRKGDCDDIELMVPLGSGNKDVVIQHIQSINPKGKTPITKSIELAAQQLQTIEEETKIVLVSDGFETCDADPCGYVKNLKNKGIKFRLDVVGFDVSAKEQGQLECIAEAGGGRYFTTQNAMQLKEAFTEVKTEVLDKVTTKAETYLGCYKDQGDPTGTNGRDLSGFVLNDSNMTTDRCLSECRSRGFTFAGTQYGSWCFCGDSYGKSGPANNCNMRCSGNREEICGGTWANSIYKIK
jgi:uncharacterized protein YegL